MELKKKHMIKYIDLNTRIKLKYYLPSMGVCICLQRKKWYGWVTVSWTYPSTVRYETTETILNYLIYSEIKNSEKGIGIEVMKKFI